VLPIAQPPSRAAVQPWTPKTCFFWRPETDCGDPNFHLDDDDDDSTGLTIQLPSRCSLSALPFDPSPHRLAPGPQHPPGYLRHHPAALGITAPSQRPESRSCARRAWPSEPPALSPLRLMPSSLPATLNRAASALACRTLSTTRKHARIAV
jgi:hypothetical protein